MRDLSHSHTLPSHPVVQENGSRGTSASPRLESVRHCPCGFQAPAYDTGGIGAGLWLDLPAPLLSQVDLASASGRLVCRAYVSRYVLSLQAIESVLAPADQT